MNMGLKDSDISKIMPSADQCLREGKWDKLSDLLTGYIHKAQVDVTTKLAFNKRDYNSLKSQWAIAQKEATTKAHAYGRADSAAKEMETTIKERVEQETKILKEENENLRKQLESRSTSTVTSLGT